MHEGGFLFRVFKGQTVDDEADLKLQVLTLIFNLCLSVH
jgi:hypothetical protein